MGHRLRLAQCHQPRLGLVALRLLVEEDPVGEDLVVGLDFRVDRLVNPEVLLRGEDHRHQGELGLVDRDFMPPAGVDQPAVEIFEQLGDVLGERLLALVEDHVVGGGQHLVALEWAGLQPLAQLIRCEGYEGIRGRDEPVREAELAVRLQSTAFLSRYRPCRRADDAFPASSRSRNRLILRAAGSGGGDSRRAPVGGPWLWRTLGPPRPPASFGPRRAGPGRGSPPRMLRVGEVPTEARRWKEAPRRDRPDATRGSPRRRIRTGIPCAARMDGRPATTGEVATGTAASSDDHGFHRRWTLNGLV